MTIIIATIFCVSVIAASLVYVWHQDRKSVPIANTKNKLIAKYSCVACEEVFIDESAEIVIFKTEDNKYKFTIKYNGKNMGTVWLSDGSAIDMFNKLKLSTLSREHDIEAHPPAVPWLDTATDRSIVH